MQNNAVIKVLPGAKYNYKVLAGRPSVARGFLVSIEMQQSLSPFKKNYKPCANFWKFDSLVTWIVLFKSLLVNNLVWSDQYKQAEEDHNNILMLAGVLGIARVFFDFYWNANQIQFETCFKKITNLVQTLKNLSL